MRLRFEYAWLGGPTFDQDVVVDIEGETIRAVSPTSPGGIDHDLGGIALPGLVSAHSHTFHRALRGSADTQGGDFWAWRKPMYRLAASLTPETVEEMAVLTFSEMLMSGITCVGEFHYVHHQPDGSPYADHNAMSHALVNAARRTGIRMTLIDALYLQSDVDGSPLLPEQTRFSDSSFGAWENRIRELGNELSGEANIGLGVAAHSVRAVSLEDLAALAEVARDMEAPLHAHVSEQPGENQACLAEHGVGPVELLHDAGFLGAATTLVHGTHVNAGDVEMIAASGATVCFCPTTEADLGDGIGPALEYTEAGAPLALGSDSNAVVDLFEEMRRVEHHDRLRLGRRGVHDPRSLLNAATADGARSVGWDDAGRIEAGALADLVVVDAGSLDLGGTARGPVSVVMAATRASVTDVMVGGRFLVRDKKPVGSPDGPDISERWDMLRT